MGLPKKPKVTPPPPVAPAPTVSDVQPAEETAAKKRTRLTGYKKQIVVGALTPYRGGMETFG